MIVTGPDGSCAVTSDHVTARALDPFSGSMMSEGQDRVGPVTSAELNNEIEMAESGR